jgi:glyoxylase-like metal-dependent hydrolase (beta-lactamase superfamily II)
MKQLYSILSNSQKLDGGAMFGNAPKALWSRWTATDDANRIDLACRCLLVIDGDKKILFETGIGAFFEPKYAERYGVQGEGHVLLTNLNRMNLTDADIDVVVLSHLHFDHAGGLLSTWEEDVEPKLLFPNAKFLVGQKQWERANNPHARDQASYIPEIQKLLEASGRLELVKAEFSATLGLDYKFHYSDGHTPGLMLTEIKSKEGPILFASDLIPGRAWVHRSITMGYDRFPEQLIDEKVTLLSKLVRKNGRVFFTHDSDIAMSRVVIDDRGRFGTTSNEAHLQSFTI